LSKYWESMWSIITIMIYDWFSYHPFWSTNSSHINDSDLRMVLISPILIYDWFSYHPFWSMIGSHITHSDLRMVLISPILIYDWFSYHSFWSTNCSHIAHSDLRMVLISHILIYDWSWTIRRTQKWAAIWEPFVEHNGCYEDHSQNIMGDMRTIRRT
jgi:hypothetical protein